MCGGARCHQEGDPPPFYAAKFPHLQPIVRMDWDRNRRFVCLIKYLDYAGKSS